MPSATPTPPRRRNTTGDAAMSEFELVWDSRCGVAELPVWDASTQRLLFCDIPGKRINALSVDDGRRTSWDLPEVVGSFGLCLSGRLVVALRHRVVLFDPRTGEVSNLTDAVDEPPTNRMNDGKVGPDGCFWVGSMDERPQREKRGALYRVTPTGGIERKAEGYAVSNGLAWSPDGRTMYHSEFDRRNDRGLGLRRQHRRHEPSSDHRHAYQPGRKTGRRRCGHQRGLLVGRPLCWLHQPLFAAGQADGKDCFPRARSNHAVLRGATPVRCVAARR